MFIMALFLLEHILTNLDQTEDSRNSVAENSRRYILICLAYVLLCAFTVLVAVSTNDTIDKVALLICEFLRIGILVNGAELIAIITDKKTFKRRTVYVVTSELYYFGIVGIAVRILLGNGNTQTGTFGEFLSFGNSFGLIAYIIVYICILFIYTAYTYMFYFSRTKKREKYLFSRCLTIVIVLVLSVAIELYFLQMYNIYVPSLNMGILICLYFFKNMIEYKRSIEYNEADYEETLSESNLIPAFVCDDEGVIIFENVRASVMKQMYKENDYIGSHLTDFFEISDYDKDRMRDPRVTQKFDVFCKYAKEPKDVLLKVKHNIDRYGEIFSSEVQYTVSESDAVIPEEIDKNGQKNYNSVENRIEVIYEDLNQMRHIALISLLERARNLYDKDEKVLFELNLMGIMKLAEIMSMAALVDLCERIHDAMVYSEEWETLNSMIINLDRQYETLKIIYSN